MKKYLLSFAVLLGLVGFSYSDPTIGVPLNQQGQPMSFADYGGFSYSTGAFVTQAVTACYAYNGKPSAGVLAGVYFSTAATSQIPTDKILFYDATSYVNAVANGPFISIANVIASTTTASATGAFQGPPKPVRFNNGLIWAPVLGSLNNGLYNLITVLYNCSNP